MFNFFKLDKLWQYVIGAATGIALLLAGYFKARQDGKNAVRQDQMKAKEKIVEKAKSIDSKLGASTDAERDKRLQPYYRD
jgi:flagellin-specific chaperone FliS